MSVANTVNSIWSGTVTATAVAIPALCTTRAIGGMNRSRAPGGQLRPTAQPANNIMTLRGTAASEISGKPPVRCSPSWTIMKAVTQRSTALLPARAAGDPGFPSDAVRAPRVERTKTPCARLTGMAQFVGIGPKSNIATGSGRLPMDPWGGLFGVRRAKKRRNRVYALLARGSREGGPSASSGGTFRRSPDDRSHFMRRRTDLVALADQPGPAARRFPA